MDIFMVKRGAPFFNPPDLVGKFSKLDKFYTQIFCANDVAKDSDGYGIVGEIYCNHDRWSEKLDQLDRNLSVVSPLLVNLHITGLFISNGPY